MEASEHKTKGERRPRLLRAITRLNVGGPTRNVALLQSGLEALGWEALLLHGPCPAEEGAGLLPVPGITREIPQLRRPINPWADRTSFRALAAAIADHDPLVVHTHQGKAGWLGRLAAARCGVPAVVHTYHGHTFLGYFGRVKGGVLLRAERWAARRSHALICQSRSQEEEVLGYLGGAAEGKTVVIPPAVDPRAVEAPRGAELRERLGVPASRRVLLLPARLVPIKAPERAVSLLRSLRLKIDAELWIAGDGPLRGAVEDQARALGVASSIRFLPPRAHPASLYDAADLVLLTSVSEGTPLSLLEAAWVGTAVACTDVGGVRDLFGEEAESLDPAASEERWAAQLLALLDDDSRRRDRELALARRVRDLHTPERLSAAVDQLYRKLLGAAGVGLSARPRADR